MTIGVMFLGRLRDVRNNMTSPGRWQAAGRILMVVGVGLVGTLAVHHPTILSGFGRIQTGLGDTRLLNYFLEHSWLWLGRVPGHERFWDAPFFFPVPNVMAFSDCMLSFGPLYWPYRAVGLAPGPAFGAWMMTTTALNYAAGVLLFRGGLGFGRPASVAGAGLIAFGSPRVNLLHHPQLLACFYPLFALYALCRIARGRAGGAAGRGLWWMVFSLAVVAQLYGGYYVGWFFGVGLVVAGLAALALRPTRRRLVELARRDWWAVASAATAAAIALIPFLRHYLPVARELGRGFSDLQELTQPVAWSWWNVGEINWCWGWIDRGWPQGALYPEELHLGLGFATTAACCAGLYLGRGDAPARVASASVILCVGAMTFPMNVIGAAAACFALACLLRGRDGDGLGGTCVALATFVLLVVPTGDPVALSLTFATMGLCLCRMWDRRGEEWGWAAPATVLIALGAHSFAPPLACSLGGVFATVGGLVVYHARGRRASAAIGVVALWLAATARLSVEDSPRIFDLAAVGTVLGWAAAGEPRLRPSPPRLALLLAASLAAVALPEGHRSAWLAFSPYIPGAGAIRMPSRVILIIIIPAALGLACLVERFGRGGRVVIASCIALLCLAEQTGTTQSFDVALNRRRIARVARQVDRSAEAFYYRPPYGDDPYFIHLDAMWAAVEADVPTVNGISGCFPSGWRELAEADVPGRPSLERALQGWCTRYGLRVEGVQIIGRGGEAPVDDGTRD